MTLIGIYVLLFLGGPLLFRAATRGAPSLSRMRMLALITCFSGVVGLGLRYVSPQLWMQNLAVSIMGLLLVWFAWIGVLAFGTHALRRSDPSLSMRRWTGVIGALGTTVPWFGLAWVNLMRNGI